MRESPIPNSIDYIEYRIDEGMYLVVVQVSLVVVEKRLRCPSVSRSQSEVGFSLLFGYGVGGGAPPRPLTFIYEIHGG